MQLAAGNASLRSVQRQASGNRLAELLEEKGLKAYDISARFRVDPSTVWRWAAGKSTIPDLIKPELAEMLDVTVSDLMGWRETA